MQSWMTWRSGLRNSSTGVPIVTITGPRPDISPGLLVKLRR